MRNLLVTRFHLLLLGVMVAITVVAFVKVPEKTGLPIHWGLNGEPDRIWPRDQALLVLPIIAAALVAVFALLGAMTPKEQVEGGRTVLEVVLAGLVGLLCALQFALLLIGIGSDIDMLRVVAGLVAALIVLIGAALPRSRPNVYAGIRLPWTMRDASNWRATHRLTGALFVVAGLALGVVTAFWPDPTNLLAGIALALILPTLLGGLYSLVRSWR